MLCYPFHCHALIFYRQICFRIYSAPWQVGIIKITVMQTKTFNYSKGNQKNTGVKFLLLAVLGAGLALYMWLWADPVNITILVGGVFLTFMGLVVFLKLTLAPRKENETAITISDQGIIASTTPIAKAAGRIEWPDVARVQLYDRLLEIQVKDSEKYAARMTNFFVKDTFLKALKGTIKISFVETNATYEELKVLLQQYIPLIK